MGLVTTFFKTSSGIPIVLSFKFLLHIFLCQTYTLKTKEIPFSSTFEINLFFIIVLQFLSVQTALPYAFMK